MTDADTSYNTLLSPYRLKHLTLKNRIIITAHAPGYAENGMLGERLQRYHLEQARGGTSLVMFGGSSSVSADGVGNFGMIDVSTDKIVPYFEEFSRRMHGEGTALICQITHMGRRARWDSGSWMPPLAPSRSKEPVHKSYPRVMVKEDIQRVVADFGSAAKRCKEGGLDGVELAFHSQQLGAQFWSPFINSRTDEYGGSLENRVRFSLEVLKEVRRKAGEDFIISVRMSGDEMIREGLSHSECLEIAGMLAQSNCVDILNVLGSQAGDWKSAAKSMANMSFPESPFLHLASGIRQFTGLPVIHAQRIVSVKKAVEALESGSIDLVGMTRAHIADPNLVAKIRAGQPERIRPCVGANYCINRAYANGEMLCLHNPATGRELTLPHEIERAATTKRIVVVGGGPAGLEAARVGLSRGHDVKLFEAGEYCGGQVRIAASAVWRSSLAQIVDWVESEVRRMGGEIALGREPSREEILAENPDVVVIATGGSPSRMGFAEENLVSTPTEFLSGRIDGREVHSVKGRHVLIFDNVGNHKALSAAEVLANDGAEVEIVTPDRHVGSEVGNNDMPIHSENLYRMGCTFTTDMNLLDVATTGNSVEVTLENIYSERIVTRSVDLVLIEDGVVPRDSLFHDMRESSLNLGLTDPEAIRKNEPQSTVSNPDGKFFMFVVGDAVASRNIHAAMLDSLRVMKDI